MRSLATALTASGTEYSNELTYQPGMAPRSANCPALEKGGMQVNSVAILNEQSSEFRDTRKCKCQVSGQITMHASGLHTWKTCLKINGNDLIAEC